MISHEINSKKSSKDNFHKVSQNKLNEENKESI